MKPQIQISEIEIIPIVPRSGLIAFASLTYNSQLRLNNLAIHTNLSNRGFRVTYPLQTLPTGKKLYAFHPINKAIGDAITVAISEEFEKLINRNLRNE